MTESARGLATNLYYDPYFDTDAAKLLPGEYYVTTKDMLMVTVLGSCVAACVRDPQSGIGGMNHFMLPDSAMETDNPVSTSARYGTYAMEVLIGQLLKLGARRGRLQAKVFGGGNVLRGFTANNVGERNSAFVLEFLSMEKIPIMAQDLVDTYPRKVYFFPRSGKVMVKKLASLHNSTIVKRETDYNRRLRSSRIAGEVELFR